MRYVRVILYDRENNLRNNLTSLKWAWFDENTLATLTSPVEVGTTEISDSSGILDIPLSNSSLLEGDFGILILMSNDNIDIATYRLMVFGTEDISELTVAHYPIASLSQSVGKHGTYNVYVVPVDSGGSPTGTRVDLLDTEIRTDLGSGNQLAFDGAEGWGRFTVGGREGTIVHVTNLNDSGAGSFRSAISAGNRTVIFDVSGTIDLATEVGPGGDFITIFGQSAPQQGVQFIGENLRIEQSQQLYQYLKIRPGADSTVNPGALTITDTGTPRNNIMIDHCEAMFAKDENIDISGENHTDISINDTISAWCLQNTDHPDGTAHSKAWLVTGPIGAMPERLSFFRNVMADCDDRHPRSLVSSDCWVNNLMINKDGSSGSIWSQFDPGRASMHVQYIGNYLDSANQGNNKTPRIQFYSGTNDATSEYYIDDNIQNLNDVESAASVTVQGAWTDHGNPFSDYPMPNTLLSAVDVSAYCAINSGAIRPAIDALTQRIHDEILHIEDGDIIDDEAEIGGPITLPQSSRGSESYNVDPDIYDDEWATHAGLGVDSAITASTIHDSGYTYLELFMNDISKNGVPNGLLTFLTFNNTGNSDTTHFKIFIENDGVAYNPSSTNFNLVAIGDVT